MNRKKNSNEDKHKKLIHRKFKSNLERYEILKEFLESQSESSYLVSCLEGLYEGEPVRDLYAERKKYIEMLNREKYILVLVKVRMLSGPDKIYYVLAKSLYNIEERIQNKLKEKKEEGLVVSIEYIATTEMDVFDDLIVWL